LTNSATVSWSLFSSLNRSSTKRRPSAATSVASSHALHDRWQHGTAYNPNDLITPSPLHLITAEYVNSRGEILTRGPDAQRRQAS
jgi:hypothetical protein